MLRTGVPRHDVALRDRLPDGSVRHWMLSWMPVAAESDAEPGVALSMIDVSAQVRATAALEAAVAAERLARERAERVQTLTAGFAVAATMREVAEATVVNGRSVAGATSAMLAWLEGGAPDDEAAMFRIAAAAGLPPETRSPWVHFPNVPGLPYPDVVRTGEPLFVGSYDALVARWPVLAEPARAVGMAGLAVLPLIVDEGPARRVLGALSFEYDAPPQFDAEAIERLTALGRQCAQALERARLAEAEAEARQRLEAATAQLAAREVFFESVTTIAPDLCYVYDRETGAVVWENRPLAALLGWPVDEPVGVGGVVTPRLVHRSDRARVAAHRAGSAGWADGAVATLTMRVRRADGTWQWLECREMVFARGADGDQPGAVQRIIGAATDVTARAAADRERHRRLGRERLARAVEALERQRLAAVLAALPHAVIVADAPSGRLVYMNAAVERIWGVRAHTARLEDYSVDWRGYHVDADGVATTRPYAADEWPLARALREGVTVEDEPIEIERPDGTRVRGFVSAAPIRDAAGAIVGGVVTTADMSEVQRTHAALAEARAAAEAANRTKSDFLATMSHELRTPLNTIQGHAHLLLLEVHGAITEAQRDALGRIMRAQKHLIGLIDDVLNYAKLEAGKVEFTLAPTALDEVVRDLLPMIEPLAAARGLRIEVAADAAWPTVQADRQKLAQVLLNLLSNAVKFTPPGGSGAGRDTIVLDLTRDRERPERVYLRVRDPGVGMSRAEQDAIFEPFVQLRPQGVPPETGTGLGLAISRDLMRGMGGDLRVRSVPSEGSAFTLTLRVAHGAP